MQDESTRLDTGGLVWVRKLCYDRFQGLDLGVADHIMDCVWNAVERPARGAISCLLQNPSLDFKVRLPINTSRTQIFGSRRMTSLQADRSTRLIVRALEHALTSQATTYAALECRLTRHLSQSSMQCHSTSPKSGIQTCKDAIFVAGAGTYSRGLYSQCCFQTTGRGQFFSNEGANPSIGEMGKIEELYEIKVELLCVGRDVMVRAVDALKRAHP